MNAVTYNGKIIEFSADRQLMDDELCEAKWQPIGGASGGMIGYASRNYGERL